MEDDLAAIREKAQALQEEAKGKRFRDRGGLWQPLSPSKNMLLGILRSDEFRNIAEGNDVTKPRENEQKRTSGSGKPVLGKRGRVESRTVVSPGDEMTSETDHPPRSNPRRRGRSKNAASGSRSRTMRPSDQDDAQVSHSEIVSSSKHNLNAEGGAENSVGKGYTEELSRKSPRRISAKRKVTSNQEGEDSKHRPSPDKKPRIRNVASSKTKSTKSSRKTKRGSTQLESVKTRGAIASSGVADENIDPTNKPNIGEQFSSQTADTSDIPSNRRRKRVLALAAQPDIAERLSLPKRGQSKVGDSPDPNEMRSSNSKTSHPSHVQSLDGQENPKRRRPCKTSKPTSPVEITNNNSMKSKQRIKETPSDGTREMGTDHIAFDVCLKTSHPGGLPRIVEYEGNSRSRDQDSSGSLVISQNNRGKSAVHVKDNADKIPGSSNNVTLTKSREIEMKMVAPAKDQGDDSQGFWDAEGLKNRGYAGMTKRRRKKVVSNENGAGIKDDFGGAEVSAVPDSGNSNCETTVRKTSRNRKKFIDVSQEAPTVDIESHYAESVPPLQQPPGKTSSIEDRGPPQTQKLPMKADRILKSRLAESQKEMTGRKYVSLDEKQKPTSRQVGRQSSASARKATSPGDEPLDLVESEVDELDLLA